MSKCFNEIDYLFYIDNEMDEKDRLKIDRHLKVCEKCKKYIDDEISNNVRIAESFKSGFEPKKLITRFHQKLSSSVTKKITDNKFVQWGLTAAVAVFVVFLINIISTSNVKKYSGKTVLEEGQQVLISQVIIEEQHADVYQFTSDDIDKKYFWFTKADKSSPKNRLDN